jgi:superfamily I DNA/RNA helicase
MTFHSLCAWLAERWPLEAGLPPGSRLLDETETPALVREALTRLRQRLLAPAGAASPAAQALERRLLRLDNRWEALEAELAQVIAQRDLFGDLLGEIGAHGGDPEALARALRQRLDVIIDIRLRRARQLLAATPLGQRWGEFVAELRRCKCARAEVLPASLPEPRAADSAAWVAICDALLTGSGTPRQALGPTYGYANGFKKTAFGPLIAGLPPACCEALALCRALPQPGVPAEVGPLADLVACAAEAIRLYEDLCRERAVMDFAGVERAALCVLSADPFPQEGLLAMDARLRHLLVDEFQDTSRNQWELIKRLCAGFSPGDGRTVFLVGDPKQSIYGFRKAEVALFEEARAGLPTEAGRLPLTPLRLSANFRSAPGLVRWANGVFARVMAEPFIEADEVPFAPAEPARQEEAAAFSLSLFTGTGEAARTAEARWLAAAVREEAARLAEGERLAVLVFARTHVGAYVRALREAGVAISVREGLPLAQRPEVAGLLALARALVRPHDDLAFAELLRSPWVEATPRDFCATARLVGWGWQERLAGHPEPRLRALVEAVCAAQERVGRLPLAEVVGSVWVGLEGPSRSARRLGPGCLANARAALGLLEACELPSGVPEETLSRFEERLAAAWQPPLDDRPESALQLMTVHAAKGLEFDAVLVPGLDWRPAGNRGAAPPYLLERLPGEAGHAVALPPDRRGAGGEPAWELVRRLSEERRLAEAKRLFYTAATRAKRTLRLSGVARLKEDGTLSSPKSSPLGWLLAAEGLAASGRADLDGTTPAGLAVAVDPAPTPGSGAALPAPAPPAGRPPFAPEPLAYRKLSASELTEEPEREPARAAIFEPSLEARLRGTIIHRLLERAAAGPLPGQGQVAAALSAEGLAAGRAAELAAEVVAEVSACLADPFLAAGLRAAERWCELALERVAAGAPGPERSLDVGIIDLVWRQGETWWLLDYKTARPQPGQGVEEFCAAQGEAYRPQMAAYRRLIAAWRNVAEESVRPVLYLTALRRPVPL